MTEPTTWQPLLTAPRDGRWIVVAFRNILGQPELATVYYYPDGGTASWVITGGYRVMDEMLDLWAPLPELPADFVRDA